MAGTTDPLAIDIRNRPTRSSGEFALWIRPMPIDGDHQLRAGALSRAAATEAGRLGGRDHAGRVSVEWARVRVAGGAGEMHCRCGPLPSDPFRSILRHQANIGEAMGSPPGK